MANWVEAEYFFIGQQRMVKERYTYIGDVRWVGTSDVRGSFIIDWEDLEEHLGHITLENVNVVITSGFDPDIEKRVVD